MDNSLYVGLSRQIVLQRAMDMVANNVANVNTPGYRAQNPIFREYISEPKGATSSLSMVYDFGQYNTTTPGTLSYTGGTYDIALDGPGFIAVNTPSGETQYTRAGNFTVNSSGEIVTAAGFTVASRGGAAIVIPPDAKQVHITEEGTVFADDRAVGSIKVDEFENLQALKPQGNGLYKADAEGLPATETRVKQGSVEGSNVNAVSEMSRMIEVMRDYQSVMNIMKEQGDRQSGSIQALAKTNG